MTVKQTFIAFDGKEFKTEEECVKYEKSINNKLKDIIPALKKIQKICNAQMDCGECVFYNSSIGECIFTADAPEWWHLRRLGE